MRDPKDFSRDNIGRSVEHTRTGESGEFLGRSALDPNVINVERESGAQQAADPADWNLVY